MPLLAKKLEHRLAASLVTSSSHLTLILCLFLTVAVVGGAAAPLGEREILLSSTCYTDAVILYNLATYIISNYGIHAATIPVGADIGRYAQRVTRQDGWQWNLWLLLISFFLPFFALSRTSILIAQQFRCRGNGVLVALQHGGIIVVVRNKDWKPGPKGQVVFVRLPHDFESQNEDALPPAEIVLDTAGEVKAYQEADRYDHKLHGIAQPPEGYSLAAPVRRGYTEILIEKHLNDTKKLTVHHRPGIVSAVLSIIQIGIGTYNLYSAQSSQIPRWGYAAYSLSVLPYVIMSVMNLLCASIVDSYACGQLLRTPILEESLCRYLSEDTRGNTEYDGTIGTVKAGSMPDKVQIGDMGQPGYVAVRMHMKGPTEEGGVPYLVVETATKCRTYRFVQGGEGEVPTGRSGEGTDTVSEELRTDQRGEGATATPLLVPTRFTVSALSHDGSAPQEDVVKADAITPLETTTLACLFFIALILPHIIIYALTRFRANHSTVAQRAWMMAWLGADQFSACSTFACWVLWKKRQNVIPDWLQKCFYGVLMITGVGGFVQVVHMYLQNHDYGLQKCSV